MCLPSHYKNEKGAVLIVTLLVLAVLVIAAFEFEEFAFNNFYRGENLARKTQLYYAARSGVYTGMDLLAADGMAAPVDTLADEWATPSSINGLIPGINTNVHIEDLSGRIPVNALVQPANDGHTVQDQTWSEILYRLLSQRQFELTSSEAAAIVAAILDWLDSNDGDTITVFHGQMGAEKSSYDSKGYSCRNGPIKSMEELLLVKGMTNILLYGDAEHPPLADYIYVEPGIAPEDQLININTAPIVVLQALSPAIDQETSVRLTEYRQDNIDALHDKNWYKNVDSTLQLDHAPITIQGFVFTVTGKATFGTMHMTSQAIALRHGPLVETLSFITD